MQELIKATQGLLQQNRVIYIKNGKPHTAKGNICLFQEVGSKINVLWDSLKGNMIISKSIQNQTTYHKQGFYEIITNIEFRHAHFCPYYQDSIKKSQKFYKPCACVMLKHQTNILITRRKLSLNSFPGAWVLPGGHLEKGQGLIQGGLRQAQQQIGLDIKFAQVLLKEGIMAWQSAFYKDNKILSCALVVFFPCKAPTFEVKVQQAEVQQFLWKEVTDNKDEHKYCSVKKDGYGQAHLNYLSFYRNKNFNIEQKKLWLITQNKQQKIFK